MPRRARESAHCSDAEPLSSHVCLSAVAPAFAEPDIHSLSRAQGPSQKIVSQAEQDRSLRKDRLSAARRGNVRHPGYNAFSDPGSDGRAASSCFGTEVLDSNAGAFLRGGSVTDYRCLLPFLIFYKSERRKSGVAFGGTRRLDNLCMSPRMIRGAKWGAKTPE